MKLVYLAFRSLCSTRRSWMYLMAVVSWINQSMIRDSSNFRFACFHVCILASKSPPWRAHKEKLKTVKKEIKTYSLINNIICEMCLIILYLTKALFIWTLLWIILCSDNISGSWILFSTFYQLCYVVRGDMTYLTVFCHYTERVFLHETILKLDNGGMVQLKERGNKSDHYQWEIYM